MRAGPWLPGWVTFQLDIDDPDSVSDPHRFPAASPASCSRCDDFDSECDSRDTPPIVPRLSRHWSSNECRVRSNVCSVRTPPSNLVDSVSWTFCFRSTRDSYFDDAGIAPKAGIGGVPAGAFAVDHSPFRFSHTRSCSSVVCVTTASSNPPVTTSPTSPF